MNAVLTPYQVAEIIRLFHNGKNNTEPEIAKILGINVQLVTKHLNVYLSSKIVERYEIYESKMNNPDA